MAILPLLWMPHGQAGQSKVWQAGKLTGSIVDWELNEASGLAVSKTLPNVLWSHNDSGDRPRLFALDKQAKVIAEVRMYGVPSYDIEDIATGPCKAQSTPQEDTPQCLFVADIGDNRHKRDHVRIYRFILPTTTPLPKALQADHIEYIRYPKGAFDAETLLVHPHTGTRWIVHKARKGPSGVFKIPEGSSSAKSPKTALHITDLRPKSLNLSGRLYTAGDISPDGKCVALRTYSHVRTHCAPSAARFVEAFDQAPDILETPPMFQSEALAFDPTTKGLWITSERWPAPLLYLPARQANAK